MVIFRFLVLLAILATFSWMDWQLEVVTLALIISRFGLLIFGAGMTMQVLKLFKVKPSVRWEHRFISCLILFLLFAPDVVWWAFPLLGAVTEGLQRMLRLPTGPMFNPAALGGLLVAILLQDWNVIPTWWGVSFAPRWFIVQEGLSIATLLTLPIAGWVAWKYKKLSAVMAIILVSAASYVAVFRFSPAFLIFEGTLLFFALVMAVEPKTSPILAKDQIIFGSVIGLMVVALQKTYFVEPYLGALVVANLIFLGKRVRPAKNGWMQKLFFWKSYPVAKTDGTTSPLPSKG